MISRTEEKSQENEEEEDFERYHLHPAFRLRHTLQSNTIDMALSPDGRSLAELRPFGKIYLWDVENCQLLRTWENAQLVPPLAWSPDGQTIAVGSDSREVHLWDVNTGKILQVLRGHLQGIKCLAWSPNGEILASGSNDGTIRMWKSETGRFFGLMKTTIVGANQIAWSPNSDRLCSCGHLSVNLLNVASKDIQVSGWHHGSVDCVAWSPDGRYIASGSKDQTVCIWEAEKGILTHVLEGHTSFIVSVFFMDNGKLLASVSQGGAVIIWRTDTWTEVANIENSSTSKSLKLSYNPTSSLIAISYGEPLKIKIFDINVSMLYGEEPAIQTIHYINAKAVLLGESGVGKSGLGIRLAEKKFRPTYSTHGAQFWHLPIDHIPGLPSDLHAELTLWDLAGQPEYRLIHQLFLDDTDAAMLLFDCSDSNEPFRGVPYWSKVLRKHLPPHAVKFLISARCDVSPITVDRQHINKILSQCCLDDYHKTSAKEDEGVEQLFHHLLQSIPWTKLPRTSTPRLFQLIRDFLLKKKEMGKILIPLEMVQKEVAQQHTEHCVTPLEIDTVVTLLQARGLVYRLAPRPGMTFVLTRPELINHYASSIIHEARNHPLGVGAIAERNVLIGDIPFKGFERLHKAQEAIVLEATIELMIRHDLCFREMGLLVFPSQINITRPMPQEKHPRTEVAYRFSGSIETIYASLVVRLSYTDYFHREDQWKYAVEFSRGKERLGFSMHQAEEGTGELEIYFHPGISEFDRVTFIRFVTDHLRTKGIDIEEEIRLYCPKCCKEVRNRDAIEARIKGKYLDIPCQYCSTSILIPKSIEARYAQDLKLVEKQQELLNIVGQRTEKEVQQFKTDQQHYVQAEDHRIHILHLSDLHLENEGQAQLYRAQLETDLIQEMKIKRLEYLVISGDIVNHATEDEYKVAFEMLDGLVKHFGLNTDRIVIVPGNHDLNWDDSEAAYQFIPKRKQPTPLPEGKYIPAGDAGILLRDESLYPQRFANFNAQFYKRIYGKDYPLDYAKQAILIERPEDQILFLELNSSWQIDHHFHERNRTGINLGALSYAIDRIRSKVYDNWLKIAVWHHPITGEETMNDEFMQQLAVLGVQVCMHGHIHEAIEDFYKYDDKRHINIISAGTSGMTTKPGIPMQYNLLTFDTCEGEMVVNTRKKEKPNGAWSADARWGDKNSPIPWYRFKVQNYQQPDNRR